VPSLNLLSAGAAQSVAEKIADRFTSETGCEVTAAYGAVGAMHARVVGGEPVDVVILSGQLIDDLLASGHLAPGSRHDLGTVGTGVAVRAGTHCVMPLLARFGVTATCRASFALYNTREEIDALARGLIKAQEFFA